MKVSFHINFHTVWGQRICIVGSIPQLGSWEPALAREMHYTEDGNWQLELDIPADTPSLEYRYFLSVNDKQIFEEWERNHRVTFDGRSQNYSLYDYWQTCPQNLPFYSSAFTQSLFAHPCNTYERVICSGQKLMIKVSAPRVEKNQCVAIVGNQPVLGNWQPERALPLSCDTFPEWHIDLDAGELTYPLEYKFILWDKDTQQPVYWETGENRVLHLPPQKKGDTTIVSGLTFNENLPLWRCAGTVVPVFSLRSEESFGVGDLGDLYKLVDWVKRTRQRVIQVLPMNDTTMTHSWRDSYPYSAISIYALHPMYISLSWLGALNDKKSAAHYAALREELNKQESVDYERANRGKLDYCRAYFRQEGEAILATPEFQAFLQQNEGWLMPYAAYCYLRDTHGTPEFTRWGEDAVYSPSRIQQLCAPTGKAWPEISFSYFLQYVLHIQFKRVSDYARRNGVVLKGDLPIGVNRTSIEAWTEPQYFNMNGQAGAPPDDFSAIGQNWSFPTYNWEVMEKDHFSWWKKRFRKLGDYFDCFRIDHILGFFRIWEIPLDYIQGLCGHFNPALPLLRSDIEHYGMPFDEERYTTPHIHRKHLAYFFGERADEVESTYLARWASDYLILKPSCDTQRKIAALFEGRDDEQSQRIKNGLFAIANEVLFLRDPREPFKFHPRISGSSSLIYQELSGADRYAFDQIYWDFFYHRHNGFWKVQAMSRLTPLVTSTDMLVCGEDLGMIPQSVPEVMNRLQILSLEIERMPKTAHREFADMFNLPYHSVCTTSTHDMSPIRNWWQEDRGKIQRYYNHVLQRPGQAPEECTTEIASQIISNHLATPSILAIIPIQDWFAMDDAVKRPDITPERINVPADPNHYWRYRMHITLEALMQADTLNEKIISLISGSGRR
ncbi:4-alpha-glucanotransferase [Parabacteroides sp. PF5-6]|uniref:4-alpha-glucanotransferase n=1 Tax=Parabacteroides sp. PF5-6 TaxID=1742403 RepID=UPI0024076F69|nr:4-alpha-glucanotransferase [Parabacteroides sp. PF5-6]MDF9830285.1 4-alpha-glucanotransferase [Parabacteroides sp. PF5-6]